MNASTAAWSTAHSTSYTNVLQQTPTANAYLKSITNLWSSNFESINRYYLLASHPTNCAFLNEKKSSVVRKKFAICLNNEKILKICSILPGEHNASRAREKEKNFNWFITRSRLLLSFFSAAVGVSASPHQGLENVFKDFSLTLACTARVLRLCVAESETIRFTNRIKGKETQGKATTKTFVFFSLLHADCLSYLHRSEPLK